MELPKGTIILGKKADRLAYVNAIKRSIYENKFCNFRVYLNSYDEQGYSLISKVPSIFKALELESGFIIAPVLNIEEGYITFSISKHGE